MKFVNLTGIFILYKFTNNLLPRSFENYLVKVADTDITRELREVCLGNMLEPTIANFL